MSCTICEAKSYHKINQYSLCERHNLNIDRKKLFQFLLFIDDKAHHMNRSNSYKIKQMLLLISNIDLDWCSSMIFSILDTIDDVYHYINQIITNENDILDNFSCEYYISCNFTNYKKKYEFSLRTYHSDILFGFENQKRAYWGLCNKCSILFWTFDKPKCNNSGDASDHFGDFKNGVCGMCNEFDSKLSKIIDNNFKMINNMYIQILNKYLINDCGFIVLDYAFDTKKPSDQKPQMQLKRKHGKKIKKEN